MGCEMQMIHWQRRAADSEQVNPFGLESARRAQRFHSSFPEYEKTPLVELPGLAKKYQVDGIFIKDESCRFGLNAFKVLGGSYCIGNYFAAQTGVRIEELTYDRLTGKEFRERIGERTFITATDGNHGRGIAWMANRMGQKCVVYMPKGSAQERLQKIRELGRRQPTHIFLQAGVGAMSGAVAGFFADYYGTGESHPIIIIVEPSQADCIFRTAQANDGTLHKVPGELKTIMAGLACGEPCSLGWRMLSSYADYFVSMPDRVAANGMKILGNPLPGDRRIISGESGAAGFGFLAELLTNPEYRKWREELKLNEDSRILCFSTEGDTDRKSYLDIVRDGKYC